MNNTVDNKIAWLCLKCSLLLLFVLLVEFVLSTYTYLPLPVSIWKWIPVNGELTPAIKFVLRGLVGIVGSLWLFEVNMIIMAPFLALLSTLILSIEECNGIYNRNMTLSAVFAAIAIAYIVQYFRPNQNFLAYNRVQIPTQIIAATYTLSGLSKLYASGFAWVNSGKYFELQVLKSYFSKYYSYGDPSFLTEGHVKAGLIEHNTGLLTLLLCFTLVLELSAFVLIVFPKWTKYYGLLLIAMHIGIFVMMEIYILGVIAPMIIVLFNPLYLLISTVQRIKNKLYAFKNA